MTKKCIISVLLVVAWAFIGVLFVPPIYNRFTKLFFKNTVDAKEWYHQVDCENLTQVHFAVKLELGWNEPSIRF